MQPWSAWPNMEERARWNEYNAEMRRLVPPHLRGSLWYRRIKAAYTKQKIDSFADSTGRDLGSSTPSIIIAHPPQDTQEWPSSWGRKWKCPRISGRE